MNDIPVILGVASSDGFYVWDSQATKATAIKSNESASKNTSEKDGKESQRQDRDDMENLEAPGPIDQKRCPSRTVPLFTFSFPSYMTTPRSIF